MNQKEKEARAHAIREMTLGKGWKYLQADLQNEINSAKNSLSNGSFSDISEVHVIQEKLKSLQMILSRVERWKGETQK